MAILMLRIVFPSHFTQDAPTSHVGPQVQWRFVDYNDKDSLVTALRGIHTLLSFVQTLSDPGQRSQRNLIDAAIVAGVKRFAPSEFGRSA